VFTTDDIDSGATFPVPVDIPCAVTAAKSAGRDETTRLTVVTTDGLAAQGGAVQLTVFEHQLRPRPVTDQ
jgi:hypothetical protein